MYTSSDRANVDPAIAVRAIYEVRVVIRFLQAELQIVTEIHR